MASTSTNALTIVNLSTRSSHTSTAGDIFSGFNLKVSRKQLVNGDLPRRNFMIEGMMESLLQDYRSVVESGQMKVNPKLAVEVFPDRINIVLVCDLMPQMESIHWNRENYAEGQFRSHCETAIQQGINLWIAKEHGKVVCADLSSEIWLEQM